MAPNFVAPSTAFTRGAAKDRLSVMLVHQRNNDVVANIDMDALQAEVAGVIAKYVNVARNANAKVGLRQDGDFDLLEMHFPLDQNSLASGSGQKKWLMAAMVIKEFSCVSCPACITVSK